MPSFVLLAPVLLPLIAAGIISAFALSAVGVGRLPAGAGVRGREAVVRLDTEDIGAPGPGWGMLLAAWLALSWAGAILQILGGTASYAAVPVSALTVPVFSLIAFAGLMASGLVPWRSWPAQVWSRPSLRAAGLLVATLYPLGLYLLVPAYDIGGGRYPHAALY